MRPVAVLIGSLALITPGLSAAAEAVYGSLYRVQQARSFNTGSVDANIARWLLTLPLDASSETDSAVVDPNIIRWLLRPPLDGSSETGSAVVQAAEPNPTCCG